MVSPPVKLMSEADAATAQCTITVPAPVSSVALATAVALPVALVSLAIVPAVMTPAAAAPKAGFAIASVATMVCFGFIDPLLIGNDDYPPPAFQTRMAGYAVGFFFFWLIAALSSAVSAYLVRTSPVSPPDRND